MLAKLILFILIGLLVCEACEVGQARMGCIIRNQVCACGLGCQSEYVYNSMQECQDSLRGKKKDICTINNPCLHGGVCTQTTQRPGYKCRCEGTGYFGVRCSRACPIPGHGRIGDFPYECIVI
ncbi:protein crumbs [Aethina tumida]|uniref:protein crumbs n=1 Tax=Aethina tumida TaxID=116153 RepID=UPI00096B019C|nr:protein crumbs [Aethina tumida]